MENARVDIRRILCSAVLRIMIFFISFPILRSRSLSRTVSLVRPCSFHRRPRSIHCQDSTQVHFPKEVLEKIEEIGKHPHIHPNWPQIARGFYEIILREGLSPEDGFDINIQDKKKQERVREAIRKYSRKVSLVVDSDPLEILYEDNTYIAVNKPPGIRVHPIHRYFGGTLVNRLIGHLGFEPKILHRLDMCTSGVVLFAKKSEVCKPISDMFRDRTAVKVYLAIVDVTRALPANSYESDRIQDGNVTEEYPHIIDQPIARDLCSKIRRIVPPPDANKATYPDIKPAKTYLKVLAYSRTTDCAIVMLRLATGRTHQIRVHLSHIGWPIVGDDMYGYESTLPENYCPNLGTPLMPDDQKNAIAGKLAHQRETIMQLRKGLKLHSWFLQLPDPESGKLLKYSALPSKEFIAAAEYLSIPIPSQDELEKRLIEVLEFS